MIPANGIEGISRHPRRPRKTLLNQIPRGALHVARKLLRPGMRTAPATAHAGHCDGLLLARQIIEAHGGSLRLLNRMAARGAVAVIRMPMCRAQAV